jgi:hypothetical protein
MGPRIKDMTRKTCGLLRVVRRITQERQGSQFYGSLGMSLRVSQWMGDQIGPHNELWLPTDRVQ